MINLGQPGINIPALVNITERIDPTQDRVPLRRGQLRQGLQHHIAQPGFMLQLTDQLTGFYRYHHHHPLVVTAVTVAIGVGHVVAFTVGVSVIVVRVRTVAVVRPRIDDDWLGRLPTGAGLIGVLVGHLLLQGLGLSTQLTPDITTAQADHD